MNTSILAATRHRAARKSKVGLGSNTLSKSQIPYGRVSNGRRDRVHSLTSAPGKARSRTKHEPESKAKKA